MPEPSPFHPLRGYSPFRALAQQLRAQFRAEDEARAAALQAFLAERDAARAPRAGALARRAAVAGTARTPSPSRKRARRLVH